MLTEVSVGNSAIDPTANLQQEKAKLEAQFGVITPPDWAVDFANEPPVYHGTTLEAVSQWAESGPMELLSHKALHGVSSFFRKPENTPGQTCGEDVKRGLDKYVFASVGKTALSDPGVFSSVVVLDHEVLRDGLVSFHELGAFDGVLLSPEERHGQYSEKEANRANDRAFEQYIRTLVDGEQFKLLFEIHLAQNFEGIDQFLSSYDFIPGKPDLHKRGTVGYKELQGLRQFCEQHLIPTPLFVTQGTQYPGPQLIVEDKVSRERVKGVILYAPHNDPYVRATARRVEKRDIAVSVIGPAAVMANSERVDISVIDRGGDDFKVFALKNALFNLCFADIARTF